MGRLIPQDSLPLSSLAPSSATLKTLPGDCSKVEVASSLPSPHSRTLLKQIHESLLNFFELRVEAQMCAAQFRLQRAFARPQVLIANDFRCCCAVPLGKSAHPMPHIVGMCAQSYACSGVELF